MSAFLPAFPHRLRDRRLSGGTPASSSDALSRRYPVGIARGPRQRPHPPEVIRTAPATSNATKPRRTSRVKAPFTDCPSRRYGSTSPHRPWRCTCPFPRRLSTYSSRAEGMRHDHHVTRSYSQRAIFRIARGKRSPRLHRRAQRPSDRRRAPSNEALRQGELAPAVAWAGPPAHCPTGSGRPSECGRAVRPRRGWAGRPRGYARRGHRRPSSRTVCRGRWGRRPRSPW